MEELSETKVDAEKNSIILKIASSTLPVTKAEASGPEVDIDHLDVFFFTDEGGGAGIPVNKLVTRERIKVGLGSESVTLRTQRTEFTKGVAYKVYVIANSTLSEEDFNDLQDLDDLKNKIEYTDKIHMTGTNASGAPQTFLMDGIAQTKGGSQEGTILNNGTVSDNTELEVSLRRAAAKIVVFIHSGDKVKFDDSATAGYFLRNMPYSTTLLAEVSGNAELKDKTSITNGQYFKWTADLITVTAYAYSHSWADESTLEKETQLIVNIPLYYTEKPEGETTDWGELHPENYYQIPISKNKELLRNHYYTVNITVNAMGATDISTPQELKEVSYGVQPWDETTIGIGGEEERPTYLYVNEDEMEMYNIDEDATTLNFTSSSQVTATIKRAYFIDKFGNEQDVDEGIFEEITATPAEGLSGNIDIKSPKPTNNAIRYIEVEITNDDKSTPRTILISQYPLEYITNIQGWYSYRDDFGGTTWELLNGNKVIGETFNSDNRITDWICGCSWGNGSWSYGKSTTGFFGSKVVKSVNKDGTSDIEYARWTENSTGGWFNKKYTYAPTTSSVDLNNARMYHVRIMASSGDYTVGRPRITNGITDDSDANAKLVSPSFMIASQLGAVMAADNVNIAASHCEQYVEVYKDPETDEVIHLNDWRLPTRAELEIIMEFQYKEDAAMDEVLAGDRYWSASGLVDNTNKPVPRSDKAIRCIRNAFDTQK